MEPVRAQILPVDFPMTAAARIVIDSSADHIFSYLANPSKHSLFDGSGTVQFLVQGPDRLFLGARFGMAMKIKIPYRITNEVVAFKENEIITWRHFMKWTWSYELKDLGSGQTEVTEIFDASKVPLFARSWLKLWSAMARNPIWMAKSLVKLKVLCEDQLKE